MRNQNGITLIALVVTIIVLLILAGISIAMLTGSNGILTRGRDARTQTNNAEIAERINMELNAIAADVMAQDNKIKDFNESTHTEANILNNIGANFTVEVTTTTITIKSTLNTDITGSVSINAEGIATITEAQK